MCVTKDKLENSESKEESDAEDAWVCFVAVKDNDDDGSDNDVNDQNLSDDNLLFTFEDMQEHMKKL